MPRGLKLAICCLALMITGYLLPRYFFVEVVKVTVPEWLIYLRGACMYGFSRYLCDEFDKDDLQNINSSKGY